MDPRSNRQAEIVLTYTLTIALSLLLLIWVYETCIWARGLYQRMHDPEVGSFDVLRLWDRPLRHQRVIEKLPPAEKYDGHLHNKKFTSECVICLEEFVSGDLFRILPFCKHVYHSHCIIRWFSDEFTCPICRSSIYLDA